MDSMKPMIYLWATGEESAGTGEVWANNLKEWTRLDSPTLTRRTENRPASHSLSHNVSTISTLGLLSEGIDHLSLIHLTMFPRASLMSHFV